MKRSRASKTLACAVLGLAVLSGADTFANQHSGTMSPGQGGMMMEPGMTGQGMMGQGMLRMPRMAPTGSARQG